MSDHKAAADYHRAEEKRAFDAQGKSGVSAMDYTVLRSQQVEHQRAAQAADSRYAAETGQTVVYTPGGEPVFRKR